MVAEGDNGALSYSVQYIDYFRPDHAGPPSQSLAREHRLDRAASLTGPIPVAQCRDRPFTMVVRTLRGLRALRTGLVVGTVAAGFDVDALARPLTFVPARMPSDPPRLRSATVWRLMARRPPLLLALIKIAPNLLARRLQVTLGLVLRRLCL